MSIIGEVPMSKYFINKKKVKVFGLNKDPYINQYF